MSLLRLLFSCFSSPPSPSFVGCVKRTRADAPWESKNWCVRASTLDAPYGSRMPWTLAAVAQTVAQEVVEIGDVVDLLNGGVDVVLDAAIDDVLAVEEDVTG